MLSIGQQLAQARKARGITHEDVAFHTRIPAARVRDLENDDLSRFANLTYAKGFLKIYSRYLDVDISGYLEQFSTADFAQAASREYVQTANATHNLPQAVFTDHGRGRRPGLYVLALLLAGLGGFLYWRSQMDEAQQSADSGAPQTEATSPAKAAARPAEAATPAAAETAQNTVPPSPAPAAETPAVPEPTLATVPETPAENSTPPKAEAIPKPPPANGKPPKAEPVSEDEPELSGGQ